MAIQEVIVEFEPSVLAWIQSYAESRGKSTSDAIREIVLEKVEDEIDLQSYDEALASDDGSHIPFAEVIARLGDRLD